MDELTDPVWRDRPMALPRGARDLTPEGWRRRQDLTAQLCSVFERWGYALVGTPIIEYFDVLARGMSVEDRQSSVRFIEADTGDVVALRSDLTPQIARMVAQHRGGELSATGALRLAYAADVIRQPTTMRERTEIHQVGVELIGDGDAAADAELVALCHEALLEVGLSSSCIDLAHRKIANRLIDAAVPEGAPRRELASLVARKNSDEARALVARHGGGPSLQDQLATLCSLHGDASVLDRADRELGDIETIRSGTGRLREILDHLRAWAPEAAAQARVDLGEVRGFDYYTGLRLRVWAPGVHAPIVRGGRYDDLLGRFGAAAPATGFAIDIDALEAALDRSEQGAREVRPSHLVVLSRQCQSAQARALAAQLAGRRRSRGERAWVQPGLTLAEAQHHAASHGAQSLTFIDIGTDSRALESTTFSFISAQGAGQWQAGQAEETP